MYILISLLIFSIFINYRLFKINKHYKDVLPYFIQGEKIDYLALQSTDDHVPGLTGLPDNKLSILYIFSRPCTPCDKNLIYLKKFARLLDESVVMRGVVLGNLSEGYEFTQKTNPGFAIFVPEDLKRSIKEYRLKFNESQFIVCRGSEISFVKTGEFSDEEFIRILNKIRAMRLKEV